VHVQFRRDGREFVLSVEDDGIGVPQEGELDRAPPAVPPRGSGLGTRLLRALAAQLRGSFTRGAGPDGTGTVAELRFPVQGANGAASREPAADASMAAGEP
jgi:two-component sensor histidine kinase